MHTFRSGPKRHYYGKGDVIAYRLDRTGGAEGRCAVFAASVLFLVYGDAFWKTYTDGDNTGLVATDSMKNFIQRETMNFAGNGLEEGRGQGLGRHGQSKPGTGRPGEWMAAALNSSPI